MAARQRHHHIKAPNPSWLAINATPPAPSRDGANKKLAAPAYSPFLLSPSVWRKAQQNGKTGKAHGGGRDYHPGSRGDVPASPRIGCMGQVKGERRCSSARAPAAPRGLESESDYARGSLAGLVMGLLGRRRGRKSRACSKVRDVPSDSSPPGSTRGARASAAARPFDPPLPVPTVSRPAGEDSGPSLWERRRGAGKALEGLRLT